MMDTKVIDSYGSLFEMDLDYNMLIHSPLFYKNTFPIPGIDLISYNMPSISYQPHVTITNLLNWLKTIFGMIFGSFRFSMLWGFIFVCVGFGFGEYIYFFLSRKLIINYWLIVIDKSRVIT